MTEWIKGIGLGICIAFAALFLALLAMIVLDLEPEMPNCDEELLLLGVAAAGGGDARHAAAMAYACVYPDAPALPLPPEARPEDDAGIHPLLGNAGIYPLRDSIGIYQQAGTV